MNRNDRKIRRKLNRQFKASLLKIASTKSLYIKIATPFVLATLIFVCVALPLAGRVAIAGTIVMGIYNAIPIIREIIRRKKATHNDNLNRS